MTPVLELVIPGAPVGASRPRVVRLKNGKSHTFISDKTVSWEERARQQAVAKWGDGSSREAAQRAWDRWWQQATPARRRSMTESQLSSNLPPPLLGAVGVSVLAIHKRPGRLCRQRDPRGRVFATTKPDIDNIAKLVMDALSKAGIYGDDTQVVRLRAESWYQAIADHVRGAPTPAAEQPRVVVAVYDLEASS